MVLPPCALALCRDIGATVGSANWVPGTASGAGLARGPKAAPGCEKHDQVPGELAPNLFGRGRRVQWRVRAGLRERADRFFRWARGIGH